MSGKIIKYAIAGAATAGALAQAVNNGIRQGWEPAGGVQVGEATVEVDVDGEKQTVTQRFFQAMVKRETIVVALNG